MEAGREMKMDRVITVNQGFNANWFVHHACKQRIEVYINQAVV